jgi:hypothetical protein
MNDNDKSPDRGVADANDASGKREHEQTDEKRTRGGAGKIPPDDQHTPGEEGEKSGGGLRGA